jgi:hypothetical protein
MRKGTWMGERSLELTLDRLLRGGAIGAGGRDGRGGCCSSASSDSHCPCRRLSVSLLEELVGAAAGSASLDDIERSSQRDREARGRCIASDGKWTARRDSSPNRGRSLKSLKDSMGCAAALAAEKGGGGGRKPAGAIRAGAPTGGGGIGNEGN